MMSIGSPRLWGNRALREAAPSSFPFYMVGTANAPSGLPDAGRLAGRDLIHVKPPSSSQPRRRRLQAGVSVPPTSHFAKRYVPQSNAPPKARLVSRSVPHAWDKEKVRTQ